MDRGYRDRVIDFDGDGKCLQNKRYFYTWIFGVRICSLAITLGCIFETSAQLDVWDVRPAIINAMRFGPAPPEIESFALMRCTNWEENTGSSSFPRSLKRCWLTSKRTDRGR